MNNKLELTSFGFSTMTGRTYNHSANIAQTSFSVAIVTV